MNVNYKRYAKFGVALLVPLAVLLNSVVNGHGLTPEDERNLLAALMLAFGVYAVPNAPATPKV